MRGMPVIELLQDHSVRLDRNDQEPADAVAHFNGFGADNRQVPLSAAADDGRHALLLDGGQLPLSLRPLACGLVRRLGCLVCRFRLGRGDIAVLYLLGRDGGK